MSLIGKPAFGLDHLPHVFGIMDAIDLAVFAIFAFEALTMFAILVPIDRVREYEPPVAAQVDIRFLRRNQQKVSVRLGPACLVVLVYFVEPVARQTGGGPFSAGIA